MNKTIISTILIILLTSTLAFASDRVIGHPEPFESEKLSSPPSLLGPCRNMIIDEWRGKELTNKHLNIIEETCVLVTNNFYDFVKNKGFPSTHQSALNYSISAIPLTDSYRSLNDNRYRFSERPKFCGRDNEKCENNQEEWYLFGWTDHYLSRMFLRNDLDVTNENERKAFQVIFAHELFHVLSKTSGSFDQHRDFIIEEKLAHKFTMEIGLGDI
jgi:hypothetical protein